MVNKRMLGFLCALMAMVMMLGMGTAVAEETRKPYTVGSVCVTVPVEWDEVSYSNETDIDIYQFWFTSDNGQTCLALVCGLDIGAQMQENGASDAEIEETLGNLKTNMGDLAAIIGMETEELTVETRTVGEREAAFMFSEAEGEVVGKSAFLLEGKNVLMVYAYAQPDVADVVLEDMLLSAQIVSEE